MTSVFVDSQSSCFLSLFARTNSPSGKPAYAEGNGVSGENRSCLVEFQKIQKYLPNSSNKTNECLVAWRKIHDVSLSSTKKVLSPAKHSFKFVIYSHKQRFVSTLRSVQTKPTCWSNIIKHCWMQHVGLV